VSASANGGSATSAAGDRHRGALLGLAVGDALGTTLGRSRAKDSMNP
jgi:ADP-ribosylglycohydrolase